MNAKRMAAVQQHLVNVSSELTKLAGLLREEPGSTRAVAMCRALSRWAQLVADGDVWRLEKLKKECEEAAAMAIVKVLNDDE